MNRKNMIILAMLCSTLSTLAQDKTLNPIIQNLINNMVYVEGGTFTMGATSEQDRMVNPNEKPAHQVTVSSFSIGRYEVTQEEWEAVMGENPSTTKGAKRPVDGIPSKDGLEFIRKLNELTKDYPNGGNFRLPTEAEWEYAARGGKKSRGYMFAGGKNPAAVAWYLGNAFSEKKTSPNYGLHKVGMKQPNELGLYDMSGNVWEWCRDWYDKDYYKMSPESDPLNRNYTSGSIRVSRGGCWLSDVNECRVSYRNGNLNRGGEGHGLRLAMGGPEQTKRTPNEVIENLINNMVYVEGGTFTVEGIPYNNEPHPVTLSSFGIGRYEVTQEEWETVMGWNPSYFREMNRPVEEVSWNDCQEFIRKLNDLTKDYPKGGRFRLPTVEEWEYAARGGNDSRGYKYAGGDDISSVAWYSSNGGETHTVGTKSPNELGIYDMTGNVEEWCQWAGCLRGGSWSGFENSCYVTKSSVITSSYSSNSIGLRLAMDVME